MPVRDARELLYAAHPIEAGASDWGSDAGYRFEVVETGRRLRTAYYDALDELIIRVIEERTPATAAAS